MKKLLLTLGSAAAVAAPLATVVACNEAEYKNLTKIEGSTFTSDLYFFTETDEDGNETKVEIIPTMLQDEVKPELTSFINDEASKVLEADIEDENEDTDADNYYTFTEAEARTFINGIIVDYNLNNIPSYAKANIETEVTYDSEEDAYAMASSTLFLGWKNDITLLEEGFLLFEVDENFDNDLFADSITSTFTDAIAFSEVAGSELEDEFVDMLIEEGFVEAPAA